jgi:acyl-coenzyme A synthetase/AMP-(fatty) acid ligase
MWSKRMSVLPEQQTGTAGAARAARPLVAQAPGTAIAFDAGGDVSRQRFLEHVHGVAALLPDAAHAVNLCEDRYRFLVSLCAAAVRGQVTLLPPSRAAAVVEDVRHAHPDNYCICDGDDAAVPVPGAWHLPAALPQRRDVMPRVEDAALAVIGFTSGSTGRPSANAKTWGSFRASTAQNLAALRDLWPADAVAHIVATVPPQHMYGMELSVLLPLFAPAAVHGGRPFFPHDVAAALAHADAHRVLVTTPVHLRALVQSGVSLPPLAGIVSATAPLSREVAAEAEARFGCEVRELFGSTETCVIARRRTALESAWTPLPGVVVEPRPDGALVHAHHLHAPVRLADLVTVDAQGRFALCGRNADLLEIAGKRASLGDLTRRLQGIAGVHDAVVFQLDDDDARGVRRIAALAVAPALDEARILAALREVVDPVFLPRPLRCVDALPRNETGKLPRASLLALLRGNMR